MDILLIVINILLFFIVIFSFHEAYLAAKRLWVLKFLDRHVPKSIIFSQNHNSADGQINIKKGEIYLFWSNNDIKVCSDNLRLGLIEENKLC